MKNVVLVADQDVQYKDFSEDRIQVLLDPLKELGCNCSTVLDNGLYCEGDERRAAVLKIEKTGPEWVKHDPEFLQATKDANVLIVHFSAVGKQLIDNCPNLELIVVIRSGKENVNVDYATEKGIKVCTCPGRSSEQVADMTVALMLALNRNLANNNLTHNEGFKINYPQNPKLMKDITVGFVGFGDIAKRVYKRLVGFGCKFLAYDPYANEEQCKELNVKLLPLNDVMANADIVSVHARLLPATQGLVGKEQFELMKPDAMFVNTARAGLIDNNALLEVLKAHKIRSAALDVFDQEPLPDDSELRKLDNVILTPHIAGRIEDGGKISVELGVEESLRFVKGEPLKAQVNK